MKFPLWQLAFCLVTFRSHGFLATLIAYLVLVVVEAVIECAD